MSHFSKKTTNHLLSKPEEAMTFYYPKQIYFEKRQGTTKNTGNKRCRFLSKVAWLNKPNQKMH